MKGERTHFDRVLTEKMKKFLRKFSYALGTNIVSTVVSLVTTLIIPKFFAADISSYGYLQIYIFYCGYVGFFHFGWCDGILLRDGGKKYEDIDKSLYASQFWLLILFELCISICIGYLAIITSKDKEFEIIAVMVAINIVVMSVRQFILYIFQTTGRIKEYSMITCSYFALYCLSLFIIMALNLKNYRVFLVGDIVSKMCSLLLACWLAREVLFCKPASFTRGFYAAKINIFTGIKLLFANMAGMLITGMVRWGIQQKWDVVVYGKISFTLSVCNLLLIFISAIALVLYPMLRQTEEKKLPYIYGTLRNMLMIFLLGMLVLYYPLYLLISGWLPQYAGQIRYMALLFPLCIYSAKQTMLVQTYMQVFRLEKEIMKVNFIGVAVAALLMLISVFWLRNLTLSMFVIVLNQMFRCVYSEIILSTKIQINVLKDIFLEIVMTAVFITASWFIGGWGGSFLYLMMYLLYIAFKRDEVGRLIAFMHHH